MEDTTQKSYSQTKFEGYTHRFSVEFETGAPVTSKMDIFANDESFDALKGFINERKSPEVLSYCIIQRSTKIMDDYNARLIQKLFKSA